MTVINDTVILAIESSCDDTGAAIIKNGNILANCIANQDIHEKYGGVVPELASRSHQKNILPVVQVALKQAKIDKSELSAIAFTQGPGLLGSLLVGAGFSKAMALGLDIPLLAVNHLQAHVLAHFIDEPKPSFPFLCLLVSGGHTQIVQVDSPREMQTLGKTIDDAAGEAFDKTAKILGLPYPGGPMIDKYAKLGDATKFNFSYSKVGELNFSFSGFKTKVLYFLQAQMKKDPNFIKKNLNDLCATIQEHIVSYLLQKLQKAVVQTGITQVSLAGGVSANSRLRAAFLSLAEEEKWEGYIPDFQYCTDNAGMIAIAGHFKFKDSDFATQESVPYARNTI
jgi:N6-L-threonylcarbamoyladenine synthase